MKPKHQRLLLLCSAVIGLGISISLILIAFQDSLVFFYTPTDLLHKKVIPQQRIRVGGLVEKHSIHQREQAVHFKVTDQKETIEVSYSGLLPDLFREGQGVVVEGYLLEPNHFQAEVVLAKHDENYMPKEIVERLKETGVWRDAQ